jgi:hypothetical protein
MASHNQIPGQQNPGQHSQTRIRARPAAGWRQRPGQQQQDQGVKIDSSARVNARRERRMKGRKAAASAGFAFVAFSHGVPPGRLVSHHCGQGIALAAVSVKVNKGFKLPAAFSTR